MTQEATVTVLGSWVLSLAYTLLLAAGQCFTWIQLQSLFGELMASHTFTGFTGSPLWPVALLTKDRTHIGHHSRLRWASSCLNRSIQVS